MAAICRHLPLITARVIFSVETPKGHPKASHTIDFGYLAKRSVPRRSPSAPEAEDMTDAESVGRASPSWIDYDDDDVEMEDAAGVRDERIGNRNEAGPSRIPLASKGKGRKIPKPIGEAGRPNCGGYNLQRKLNWDKDIFEEIKSYVNSLASDYLNMSLSYKYQKKDSIQLICMVVAEKFDMIDKYEDAWPVCAMLKMSLKNSAQHARKKGVIKSTRKDKATRNTSVESED